MGILEREALEDHYRSYNEGYSDGYRAGYNDGWQAAIGTGREQPHPLARGKKPGNPHPKKRRKTAYQGAYSAAYKRLKKKHPRMAFGSLCKKAHAAARKKVKR